MADPNEPGSRRGPRREAGAPSGPDEVRRAVLDAAASQFAERGVDRVTLREVASGANVHPALIGRYIGAREDLVQAVFDDLSAQLAAAVLEHPLSGQGFGSDTVMGKWVRIASALVIAGQPIAGRGGFNPVLAMAETLRVGYGLDPDASRLPRRRSLQRRSGGASSRTTSCRPVSLTPYRSRPFARNWFALHGDSVPPHGHRHLTRHRARSETTPALRHLRPWVKRAPDPAMCSTGHKVGTCVRGAD